MTENDKPVVMLYKSQWRTDAPWQTMVVSSANSAMTDGQMFDLIKHYQEGTWTVHVLPFPEGVK